MVIIFGFAWDKLSLLTILPIYTQRPPEVYTLIGLCEPTIGASDYYDLSGAVLCPVLPWEHKER